MNQTQDNSSQSLDSSLAEGHLGYAVSHPSSEVEDRTSDIILFTSIGALVVAIIILIAASFISKTRHRPPDDKQPPAGRHPQSHKPVKPQLIQ